MHNSYLTKHKYGDRRVDGYVFQCYAKRNGVVQERWRSPEAFERWRRRVIANITRRRQVDASVRIAHAKDEARRRMNPNYKRKQTAYKNQWRQRRCSIDAGFKMLCRLRKRVWDAVRGHGKSASTLELLGTTIEGLKLQLAAGFLPGMTWDNYGSVWEIDHRVPCARFDLSEAAQQRACFHYTNLRPLWRSENRARGARL